MAPGSGGPCGRDLPDRALGGRAGTACPAGAAGPPSAVGPPRAVGPAGAAGPGRRGAGPTAARGLRDRGAPVGHGGDDTLARRLPARSTPAGAVAAAPAGSPGRLTADTRAFRPRVVREPPRDAHPDSAGQPGPAAAGPPRRRPASRADGGARGGRAI